MVGKGNFRKGEKQSGYYFIAILVVDQDIPQIFL